MSTLHDIAGSIAGLAGLEPVPELLADGTRQCATLDEGRSVAFFFNPVTGVWVLGVRRDPSQLSPEARNALGEGLLAASHGGALTDGVVGAMEADGSFSLSLELSAVPGEADELERRIENLFARLDAMLQEGAEPAPGDASVAMAAASDWIRG